MQQIEKTYCQTSAAFLLPALAKTFLQLKDHVDYMDKSRGFCRNLCDLLFHVEHIYCVMFYRAAAIANLRLQGKSLTSEGFLVAMNEFKAAVTAIINNDEKIIEMGREVTKFYLNLGCGRAGWMATRSTLKPEDIDGTHVDTMMLRNCLNLCLDLVDEKILAERASSPSGLISTMFCETVFSSFTLIRNKYRTRMKNPLLYLSIAGIHQTKRLLQLDLDSIADKVLGIVGEDGEDENEEDENEEDEHEESEFAEGLDEEGKTGAGVNEEGEGEDGVVDEGV